MKTTKREIEEYDRVIHLSHEDLDGFSCQVLTKMALGDNVEFTNTSYADVGEKIKLILEAVKKVPELNILFLITDVNLKSGECLMVENYLKENSNLEVILLDHHATGADEAAKYDWYDLDTKYSATKLTYMFLLANTNEKFRSLGDFVEIVNTYDLWREEDVYRHKVGTFLNEVVFEGPRFPKILHKERGEYIRYMLLRFAELMPSSNTEVELPGLNIRAIEEEFYPAFKKAYLKIHLDEAFVKDITITMRVKFDHLIFKFLKEMDFAVVSIDDVNFKVFFELDGGIFQTVSHLFNRFPDDSFNACINIKGDGKVSARCQDPVNVGRIAKDYFIEGGGHPCAAGGKISNTRLRSYEEAVAALQTCGQKK